MNWKLVDNYISKERLLGPSESLSLDVKLTRGFQKGVHLRGTGKEFSITHFLKKLVSKKGRQGPRDRLRETLRQLWSAVQQRNRIFYLGKCNH